MWKTGLIFDSVWDSSAAVTEGGGVLQLSFRPQAELQHIIISKNGTRKKKKYNYNICFALQEYHLATKHLPKHPFETKKPI
jgi:hypothetical protein